jgi:xanthine dehydrogenase accessory factor
VSDLRVIARELLRAAECGESVVVASVVRTEGSAYRGVGARMVVRDDESTVGLLSGGCLEGDLVRRSATVRSSGIAEIATYDGRSAEDLIWGLGLGCNGLVEVLLERFGPREAEALGALLSRALDGDTPSVIATVIRSIGDEAPEVGARVLVRAPLHLDRQGEWNQSVLLDAVVADARNGDVSARRGLNLQYALAKSDAVLDATVTAHVTFEVVAPTVDVVICGSGPDVIPVARLATMLGWSVTVVDHRPVSLTPRERFGSARVVECARSDCLDDVVAPASRSAAIVMSHNYERDLDYLDALGRSGVAYIGMLGPRARTDRLLDDLEARGRRFPEWMRERIYAPIGLDVGGDGAESIALSIIAEISAVMNDRSGSHLREAHSSIHEEHVGV